MLPPDNEKRFVIVLNKKIEAGRLMNTIGHMIAGLVAAHEDQDELNFLKYTDKEDEFVSNISHYPVIVLKADNSNKVRKAKEEAKTRNMPYTTFTSTMLLGTSEEQMAATAKVNEEELEYIGICFFGKTEEIKEFTNKFGLYQ